MESPTKILSINEDGLNIDLYENVLMEPHIYYKKLTETDKVEYLQNLKICGYPVPRQMAAYGDTSLLSYSFSGLKIKCKPWTPTLFKIKQIIENILSPLHGEFNFVLINKYRGGFDRISKHKDDESDLEKKYPIAALSLGETRTIIFNRSGRKSRKIILKSNSLLVMKWPTNEYWFHEIPREVDRTGTRISLTFRKIIMSL